MPSISKCVASSQACDEPSGAEEPSADASTAKAAADALLQLDASLDEYNIFDDFDPLAFDAGEILSVLMLVRVYNITTSCRQQSAITVVVSTVVVLIQSVVVVAEETHFSLFIVMKVQPKRLSYRKPLF